MTPKSFAISLAAAMTSISSIAYACPAAPEDEFMMLGAFGAVLIAPYVIATSLLLILFRNRWLEGSWLRWMKQTALSYVVAYTGWVIGGAVCVFAGLSGDAYGVVLWTTPLVLLSGQIALLRSRAPKPDQSVI